MNLKISQEDFAQAVEHIFEIIDLLDEILELHQTNNELIEETDCDYMKELEDYQEQIENQVLNLKEVNELLIYNLTQCCHQINNLDEKIATMIMKEVST